MARLPQPGGDQGSWGGVLNDFLSVSLTTDGEIKDGIVSENNLDTAVKAKLNTVGGASPVSSVAGKTGDVTLSAGDVGLGNVNNTADSAKPISSATQTALNAKADSSAVTSGLATKADASAVASALNGKIDVSQKGAVDGVATLGESGLVLPEQLATGTASGSTFLRGDGVWGVPGGSGGGGTVAWVDITDKPVVIASGATQAAARTAIGAGTSSLTLAGTGSATTASKSDHTHTVSSISATGTASSTTYLRGDGTWATPAGGSGTVTAANITDATTVGRNVLTAADAATARTAIGAGTSSLAIGTTSSTAAAGNHTHAAADITSGTVATARLGSGTASSTTFLRGDGTWATPSGGTAAAWGSITGTLSSQTDLNTALNSKVTGQNGTIALWKGTQTQYNAISSPNANTVYVIVED